jgi:succinyl-diaminopimelate desuccinylase
MAIAKQIMNRVAGYENQIVEHMSQIVAVPALGPDNGGQGEAEKAEVVEAWLRELGMDILRVDAPDDRVDCGFRPNIIATYPGGDGPKMWVLSHLDVVPTGPVELWSSDPWTLRREGDRLYGRGTLDNHCGIISSFFALKALIDMGITPKGQVGLIMVSDEETGSQYGLDYVVQNKGELFSPDDLIVVPDVGNDQGTMIEVAEKSILWLKVVVNGLQVHGSTPEKGVNALYTAARMMVAVREAYRDFPQQDDLYEPPISTYEPTRTEAGVPNINTIPGKHEFYIDCRVLPEIDLKQLLKSFTDRFQAIAAEEGARVELIPIQMLQAPQATPVDAPVVNELTRLIKEVKGKDAVASGVGGGTVASFFRARGLKVAVWCTMPDTAHMPDEYSLMPDLIGDAQIFARMFAGV